IGDGWAGLLGEAAPRVLVARDVAAILGEGGTILGTSRTDPRKDDASRRAVLDGIRRFRLDALVAVGGNDTLGVAQWLHEQGVAVVGVPKTVDNDLAETDFCIGFDTAVTVVADALDRLRTTASARSARSSRGTSSSAPASRLVRSCSGICSGAGPPPPSTVFARRALGTPRPTWRSPDAPACFRCSVAAASRSPRSRTRSTGRA